MKELIITTIAILIASFASIYYDLNNKVLNSIIDLIPIAIPTVYMWYNTPKNYLKIMSIKRTNVQYEFYVSIKDVLIKEKHFKHLIRSIIDLDYNNKGKVVNNSYGPYIFKSDVKLNSAIIEVVYNVSNSTLILKAESIANYNLFFDFADNILKNILALFGNNEGLRYKNENVISKVKINFIDKKNTDTKNPFWKKIFGQFNKKIINFTYQGKNNSKVLISNDSIEITNNNIKSIKKDIKSELKFF